MFPPAGECAPFRKWLAHSDDPALDARNQGWECQALGDITLQPLSRDSGAWRNGHEQPAATGP